LPTIDDVSLVGIFGDVQGLRALSNLKALALHAPPCGEINFGWFPRLKRAEIDSLDDGRYSVFDSRSVNSLYVMDYPFEDMERVASMVQLVDLSVGPARRLKDVDALSALTSGLQSLGFYYCPKVSSWASLKSLVNLRKLDIENSAPRRIDFVSSMAFLGSLSISDCKQIETLAPIKYCTELREVWASGSTNIADGDLSPLMELPHLQTVALANRRHYVGWKELPKPT